MENVYVFLADGVEEIEALTVVDLLRRARIETQTVSMMGRKTITGSHKIEINTDVLFEDISVDDAKVMVLPGGMPGTQRLAAHEGLAKMLKEQAAAGGMIAAICAAPSVLGGLGLLDGKVAVCYPGYEDKLTGATIGTHQVEVDGNVTTSRGMGTAIPFALSLVAQLTDQETADALSKKIVFTE